MPRHLVFDVNETLLDLAALDPFFEQLFGHPQVRSEWFLTLEEGWMTATIIGQYQPFGELAQAALRRVGQRHGVEIGEEQEQALAEQLKTLPAHSDVHAALTFLKNQGFSLTALTNSGLESVQQQLQLTGLADRFDHIMAVSEIQRFKPAPETYRMVAQRLGVPLSDMMMIAAHVWDVTGAASVGCHTAFVERPGKVLDPKGFQPDLIGKDLQEVAEKVIALQGQ